MRQRDLEESRLESGKTEVGITAADAITGYESSRKLSKSEPDMGPQQVARRTDAEHGAEAHDAGNYARSGLVVSDVGEIGRHGDNGHNDNRGAEYTMTGIPGYQVVDDKDDSQAEIHSQLILQCPKWRIDLPGKGAAAE